MKQNVEERVIKVADYLISNPEYSNRVISEKFGVSKETIFKDLTIRLPLLDPYRYSKVREILDEHLKTRYLKSGKSSIINTCKDPNRDTEHLESEEALNKFTLEIAKYKIEHEDVTLTEIARIFNTSNSTVSNHIHKRLPMLDKSLYKEILNIKKRGENC